MEARLELKHFYLFLVSLKEEEIEENEGKGLRLDDVVHVTN